MLPTCRVVSQAGLWTIVAKHSLPADPAGMCKNCRDGDVERDAFSTIPVGMFPLILTVLDRDHNSGYYKLRTEDCSVSRRGSISTFQLPLSIPCVCGWGTAKAGCAR